MSLRLPKPHPAGSRVYNATVRKSRLSSVRPHFLPPLDYYMRELGQFSRVNAAGWAQTKCPFHDDHRASLSVQLVGRGAWKCFAGCGSGDLIAFHMKRSGLSFVAAMRDLARRS